MVQKTLGQKKDTRSVLNRLQVSKKLGVSETAIRKMLKRGNLDVKNNIVDESPSGMASDSESEIM